MRSTRLTGWRRVANAMWSAPDDPQIYGVLELDARPLCAFIHAARARGHRLTPTHLVGRALAFAMGQVPALNVHIAFGRAIARDTIDIFFITSTEGGRDLSGVKIERADEKTALDLADELQRRAAEARSGRDPAFARAKRRTDRLPIPLLRGMLRLGAHVVGDLERSVPSLGLFRRPFGSAVVSSVGMLGLPTGFAPLSWMYRVPLVLLVGEIVEKPVVEGAAIVARPLLAVSATIDHRYVDGWHISQLVRHFRAYLEEPGAHEPAW